MFSLYLLACLIFAKGLFAAVVDENVDKQPPASPADVAGLRNLCCERSLLCYVFGLHLGFRARVHLVTLVSVILEDSVQERANYRFS
jgi:hypothetical protein